MSSKHPQNRAASLHQRLLNLSHGKGERFQLLSLRFAIERLLYRLSISPHAHQFILKGAMLFAVWSDVPHRPTRDVDLLAFCDADQDTIRAMISRIMAKCLIPG